MLGLGLLEADGAAGLLGFIQAALVAKRKVLASLCSILSHVYTFLDVLFGVKGLGAAILTLETVVALPVIREVVDGRLEAKAVVGAVTSPANG